MANQFAGINNALGILKNYYAGPIVSQFNDEVRLYKGAERGKEKWSGLVVKRPIKVRRNPGIGATSDGGNLPSIGKQTTIQAEIAAKYNYLRFGVTGPMIKASQGDKGAFVSIMEFEMTEGLTDAKKDFNRQLFWNGRGDLATLSAAAIATNVITVTGRTSGEAGNKYLEADMVIDIVDPATGTVKASGIAISSVSGTATATVTLGANVTAAASDIVVRTGAYNLEVQGLETFLDGGTSSIYGVDRSLYPIFNGTEIDALGAQLRLDLKRQALSEARKKGGPKVSAIFCDFDAERYYDKLLVADKRYIGKEVKGDGTFVGVDESFLEFGGVPVVADVDCPGPRFYYLNAQGWKKYVLGSEFEWADETGSYMIAQSGTDAFEVRLRTFANMFHEKPSSCSKLENFISP